MKSLLHNLFFIILIGGLTGCGEDTVLQIPDEAQCTSKKTLYSEDAAFGNRSDSPIPRPCGNIIVAHRCGAKEAKLPDNSLAALDYAIRLGVYAAECDVYITKDNKVIVAHADGATKINGFYPWEATLEQIREGGTLDNGEEIPTLDIYIRHLMESEGCTKLWIDLKMISKPTSMPEQTIRAFDKSMETIKEMKAEEWVEFICTANAGVMTHCFPIARNAGIPIGWMANKSGSYYAAKGYDWANLNVEFMNDASHSGDRTLNEFFNAGVEVSLFNIDSETDIEYYRPYRHRLKGICTNYPKTLIKIFNAESSVKEIPAD